MREKDEVKPLWDPMLLVPFVSAPLASRISLGECPNPDLGKIHL